MQPITLNEITKPLTTTKQPLSPH